MIWNYYIKGNEEIQKCIWIPETSKREQLPGRSKKYIEIHLWLSPHPGKKSRSFRLFGSVHVVSVLGIFWRPFKMPRKSWKIDFMWNPFCRKFRICFSTLGNFRKFLGTLGNLCWNCPSLKILPVGRGARSPENAEGKGSGFDSHRRAPVQHIVLDILMMMRWWAWGGS